MQIEKEKIEKAMHASETQNIAAAQADVKEKSEKSTKKAIAFVGLFLAFLVIVYMYYSPLQILERADEQVRNATSMDEVDNSLVADPEEMARQHRELIEQTQEMYTEVRDEIVEVIKDGPITDAALGKCEELVASGEYGPNAKVGSFQWYIPESAEEMDLTLSASEADQLIYLYSQLYDMDFMNGKGTTFEGWFYGVEGTTALYPVEAFGNTYYYEGRGGYCMPLPKLKEVKEIATRMANKAAKEAAAKDMAARANTPLAKLFVFLAKPFISVADAAAQYPEEAANAYAAAMEAGYQTYGTAAAQTIIYTGIHDTLTGDITFTISSEPAKVWPDGGDTYENSLEEFYKDSEALAIVADYNSMPFKGKLTVQFKDNTSVKTKTSEETFTIPGEESVVYEEEPIYRTLYWVGASGARYYASTIGYAREPVSPVYDYNDIIGYKTVQKTQKAEDIILPCWHDTQTTHNMSVKIQAFDVQEWVNFVGTANVNGSSLTNARQTLLETSIDAMRMTEIPDGMSAVDYVQSLFKDGLVYPDMLDDLVELANSTVGETDGYKYMSNAYMGWCAGWVYGMYNQLGLTEDLQVAGDITKDVWTTYDVLTYPEGSHIPHWDGSYSVAHGYDHCATQKIAQFGYDGDDAYEAKVGDIMFWRREGQIAHIGIVTAVSKDSVTVTQGNSNDKVEIIEYTNFDDGCGLKDGEIVKIPYDDYQAMQTYGN